MKFAVKGGIFHQYAPSIYTFFFEVLFMLVNNFENIVKKNLAVNTFF